MIDAQQADVDADSAVKGDEGRLRVLFVCGADFRSPTEKVVLGYTLGLLDLGHEVMIALRGDPGTAETELAGALPTGLSILDYRFEGPILRSRDRKALSRFDPDVVHAFNPRFDVIKVARNLNRDIGMPLVVHFEDDEWGLAGENGSRTRLRRAGRWIALRLAPAYPPLWPLASPGTLRWVRENATALEAITPELASHVSSMLGRDCSVLLPVHPGIGSEVAVAEPPLPADVSGRDLVVFTGAVFTPHAPDFGLLLEAMGELKRRGGDVALLYAGVSAPRFDLGGWARRAGLDDRDFVQLGYLEPAELQGLLRRATILVQPGAPTDFNRLRLPSKLQAYLASGVPTVTFACGAGELFEDRKDVLKTYGGEAGELADRVGELLADASLRERLSANGPAAAERLFDLRRNTAALIDIYRRAIESPAAATGLSPAASHRHRSA